MVETYGVANSRIKNYLYLDVYLTHIYYQLMHIKILKIHDLYPKNTDFISKA